MKRLLTLLLLLPTVALAQTQHDRSINRGTSTFDTYKNTSTVVITGATPSVALGNVFKTNNGSTTTITNFVGGTDSQRIVILCGEANTIIANNANISIAGGSDFSCVLNTGIEFVYDASQSKWIENGGTGTGGGGGGSPGAPAQAVQINNGAGGFAAGNATDNGSTFAIGESTTVAGNHSVTGTETIGGATTIGGMNTVKGDSQLCGTSPYKDVRCYGVRATAVSGTPFVPGITATVSGTTATLSGASSFQNGDGVTVWGAGAICPLSAPTGVTATPTIASGPTGTFLDVAAPAGSTPYAYEVIAVDKLGCYTAASSQATTSTGRASLGAQNLTISGFTQSGNTVTATVSSTTSLSVGTFGYVTTTSGTDASTFGGAGYVITSIPNGTTFTYTVMSTVAGGAAAVSQSGGTFFYWNSNKISWTPVSGAYQYYVYGRTSGSLVPVCTSWINNVAGGFTVSSCDDYGATMMAGQIFPYWLPSTPPASPLPDPLTTTIVSGAGTTTLTLANAATTSVSGQTILFDNAPNIATAAGAGGGLLYFPPGSYVINSHLVLPGTANVELAQATLYLNATMEAAGSRFLGMIGPQGISQPSFGWPVGGLIHGSHTSPAVWDTNGNTAFWEGIQVQNDGNGNIGLLTDGDGGGAQSHYKNINFVGSASNGYMDIPLVMRGGFWYDMDHISINTGPGQAPSGFIGSTSTPGAYIDTGGINFGYMSVQDRGIFHIPASNGANVTFYGQSRDQGGITPFFSIYGPSGFTGGKVTLSGIEVDTAAMNVFNNIASLNSGYSGTVACEPTFAFPTSSGYSLLTGAPVGMVTGACGGQNNAFIFGSNFTNSAVQINANGEFMFPIANSTAPTAAVGAGGGVPVGNLSYEISVIDVNGNESTLSPYVNVTTTSGNQTVTVTPPVAPAGAIAWRPYRCFANGLSCSLGTVTPCSSGTLAFGTTYIDTSASGCGNGPQNISRAGAQTLSNAGLSGTNFNLLGSGFKSAESGTFTANHVWTRPDLTGTAAAINAAQTWSGNQTNVALVMPSIGGETITASPRGPLNAILPGALTTTWTGQTWTLDKAITVTRMQTQLRVAPSGCGTNPIIRLSDGTNNVNLTLTSGANDSGAISQAYAAAAVLTVSVQTAASGCTTNPGDANVAIEFKMQ